MNMTMSDRCRLSTFIYWLVRDKGIDKPGCEFERSHWSSLRIRVLNGPTALSMAYNINSQRICIVEFWETFDYFPPLASKIFLRA